MKRIHLIEIHDQDWCPRTVRDGETDYLQFVIATTKPYAAMVPILAVALQRTGTAQVLDLCSGAAGPRLWLQPVLAERGVGVSVCLTDKYPNPDRPGYICTWRLWIDWSSSYRSRRHHFLQEASVVGTVIPLVSPDAFDRQLGTQAYPSPMRARDAGQSFASLRLRRTVLNGLPREVFAVKPGG